MQSAVAGRGRAALSSSRLTAPPARPVIRPRVLPLARKPQKIPFVELYAGRLQGVVSSGSD